MSLISQTYSYSVNFFLKNLDWVNIICLVNTVPREQNRLYGTEQNGICICFYVSMNYKIFWSGLHRITEWVGLEHSESSSCSSRVILQNTAQDCIQMVLEYSQWGIFHNLFVNLFQCTVICTVKKFFLMFRCMRNILSCSLPLTLLLKTTKKSLALDISCFTQFLRYF